MLIHVLEHSFIDTLKMLPFLLIAFLFLEFIEHRASEKTMAILGRSGKAGTVIGAALGLIPQCGISVIGANFFADRVITIGTLLAIFLSTSDEALVILLSDPTKIKDVLFLLIVKFVIAVVAGYVVDIVFKKLNHEHLSHHLQEHHDDHCHDGCGCSCNSQKAFWKNALKRTASVWIFLFLASFALGLLIEFVGEESLSKLLLTDSLLQPFLTGIVGLIPNCAASAIIAQMYIEGALSIGSVISGLCSSAGLGLLVLFKSNKNLKENLTVLVLLYFIGVICGTVANFVI